MCAGTPSLSANTWRSQINQRLENGCWRAPFLAGLACFAAAISYCEFGVGVAINSWLVDLGIILGFVLVTTPLLRQVFQTRCPACHDKISGAVRLGSLSERIKFCAHCGLAFDNEAK